MKPGVWEIRTTGVVESGHRGVVGSVVADVLRRRGIVGLSKRMAANDPAVCNELRANPALLAAISDSVDGLLATYAKGGPAC